MFFGAKTKRIQFEGENRISEQQQYNKKKEKKNSRHTKRDVYSNSNTTFSNLIYKLEEETMLNELKQLIKASGRHTNVQKKV